MRCPNHSKISYRTKSGNIRKSPICVKDKLRSSKIPSENFRCRSGYHKMAGRCVPKMPAVPKMPKMSKMPTKSRSRTISSRAKSFNSYDPFPRSRSSSAFEMVNPMRVKQLKKERREMSDQRLLEANPFKDSFEYVNPMKRKSRTD